MESEDFFNEFRDAEIIFSHGWGMTEIITMEDLYQVFKERLLKELKDDS